MNNNPLRQYFRRPALYIKLPSRGKFYPEGSLVMEENGELPVYPMTAIDEITSKTPDAVFNGSAMADIIKSCVPNIKEPWKMPSVDLDAVLVAIRAATNGNDMDIESKCPECDEEGNYSVNLMQLFTNLEASGYSEVLKIGDLTIKIVPLSYKQMNDSNTMQFEIQRAITAISETEDEKIRSDKTSETMKKLADINSEMLANSIESITTPGEVVTNKEFIVEYLRGCAKESYEQIRKHIVDAKSGSSLKPLDIKCVHCGHEYEQSLILNISDFFE